MVRELTEWWATANGGALSSPTGTPSRMDDAGRHRDDGQGNRDTGR